MRVQPRKSARLLTNFPTNFPHPNVSFASTFEMNTGSRTISPRYPWRSLKGPCSEELPWWTASSAAARCLGSVDARVRGVRGQGLLAAAYGARGP